jgi:hypothetical protein
MGMGEKMGIRRGALSLKNSIGESSDKFLKRDFILASSFVLMVIIVKGRFRKTLGRRKPRVEERGRNAEASSGESRLHVFQAYSGAARRWTSPNSCHR